MPFSLLRVSIPHIVRSVGLDLSKPQYRERWHNHIQRPEANRHVSKHPLIVIGGAAGNPPKLLIVNFARQVFLSILAQKRDEVIQ